MNKRVIITLSLVLLAAFDACTGGTGGQTITISGAFALYPLAVRWKEEYAAVKPEIRLEVAAGGAGKGMTDVLGGLVDIAMVSREINEAETEKGALPFAVAKDAVIPTINRLNPSLAVLRTRGVTAEECAAVWIGQTKITWNEISGLSDASPINVYTRSDACGAGEVWAKFLGGKSQDDLGGVQVSGDPGVAEAVVKDARGIGYNNINFVYDAKTLMPVEGLEVLKLDFSGNGKIDPAEDAYATRTDLIRAIRDGRFPSPPARNLYFVTKGRPDKHAAAFILWVLTEGQLFIEASGYIAAPEEDIARNLEALESR